MELSISLIISIVIAVYLAVDAKKHDKSPVLWAILGFIFGFFALGIYFIRTGRTIMGWIIVVFAILWFILMFVVGIFGAIMTGLS